MVEEHGRIDAVYMEGRIPHPVHFREGMQIRNFMREQPECKGWTDHEYDDNWVKAVEQALNYVVPPLPWWKRLFTKRSVAERHTRLP